MSDSNSSNGSPVDGRPDKAWDELLSAYVDGEVSDDERAEVEARLAVDPTAREVLSDFQELSRSLKELPQHQPPRELLPAVMKMTGQLPAGKLVPSAALPRQSRGLRRREWLAGLIAVATTIVLAVSLIPQAMPPERFSLELAHGDRRAMASRSRASGELESLTADSNTRGTEADFGTVAMSGELPRLTTLDRDGDSRVADLVAADGKSKSLTIANSVLPSSQPDSMTPSVDPGAIAPDVRYYGAAAEIDLKRLETWQEVQPYLNLLSQNSGTVANFDLVVVDVKQAADQFEVLLLQNGIQVQPQAASELAATASGKAATTRSLTSATKSPPEGQSLGRMYGEGELVAVYVEANGEPITKALEEMVRQRRVVALKLQPPLQVELSDESELLAERRNATEKSGELADKGRDVAPGLRDAYWNWRAEGNELAQGLDAPVSAEFGRQNALEPGRQRKLAENPFRRMPSRDSVAANPLAGVVTESLGVESRGGAVRAPRPEPVLANADPAAKGELNFSQRLSLVKPDGDWLDELKRQQGTAQNLADFTAPQIAAFTNGEFSIDQSRFLRNSFREAAPNTVRVLFVLQSVPEEGSAPPAGAAGRPK